MKTNCIRDEPNVSSQLTPRELLREAVVEHVRKGFSMRKTSKHFHVPLTTVAYWCKKAGVLSPYLEPGIRVSDAEIIKYIVFKRCVTADMCKKFFRLSLYRRLERLTRMGLLKCFQPNMKHLYRYYKARKFYALSSEGFIYWFLKDIPDEKFSLAKRRCREVSK